MHSICSYLSLAIVNLLELVIGYTTMAFQSSTSALFTKYNYKKTNVLNRCDKAKPFTPKEFRSSHLRCSSGNT